MVDISAVGSTLTIKAGDDISFTLARFSDEAAPWDFDNITEKGFAKSLNGDLLIWAIPVPVTCTVTVIANSEEDLKLQKLLRRGFVKPGGSSETVGEYTNDVVTATLKIPSITTYSGGTLGSSRTVKTYSFPKGSIVSGPPAPSISTEGRVTSRTYGFVFESLPDDTVVSTTVYA